MADALKILQKYGQFSRALVRTLSIHSINLSVASLRTDRCRAAMYPVQSSHVTIVYLNPSRLSVSQYAESAQILCPGVGQ